MATKRVIEVEFWIEDIVYRKIDGTKGIVTGISVNPGNYTYRVSLEDGETDWLYDFELSKEKVWVDKETEDDE